MTAILARRTFVAVVGGAAIAWPLAARAQQADRVRRIAVVNASSGSDPAVQARVGALRDGLAKLGWTEGRNLRIERRSGIGTDADRVRTAVAEILATNPEVLVNDNTPIVQELQRQTQSIPIVFVSLIDPVVSGVVSNLARPGGNTTGMMNFEPAMGGKWLSLIKQAAPAINRVLVLVNGGNVANEGLLRAVEASAPTLGVNVSATAVRQIGDAEHALNNAARESNAGAIVLPGNPLGEFRKPIIALATRLRIPTIHAFRFYVEDGALMSYGADINDIWRSAASYVDRVLKGEKAGDLPVQAPTKFALVINLKTAKALGLTISREFLLLADEVIE